ncbi:alpha-amylase [Aromatoleum evansii]|nr:alpha-amylase [Aromatoleum evansii]
MSQQQLNHHANQRNPNRGTSGTNAANGQVHGNRGHQIQLNQKSR